MTVLQLLVRDTLSDVESAPQTFSSWDKCMQKAYCKWPAIIGIVVGSLIILSLLFCLARCLCCGMECCCSCFSCCDCCSRGGGGRKRSNRYDDGPSGFAPNSYQGYQPTPTAPPAYEPPRFAQFEAPSKNGKPNEDALPAMPSWDNAASKRVEDPNAHEDVEMGNLNRHSGQTLGAAAAGGPGGRGRYSQLDANPASAYNQQQTGYRGSDSTHPYGGDIGAQQARPDYDYSRPSPSAQQSYHSPQPSPYAAPYDSHYRGPSAGQAPQGGFRAPASEDQLQPSALAPTPNLYNHGYDPKEPDQALRSSWTGSSSTKYEPSAQYNHQDTGYATAQMPSPHGQDNRPPSLLQAGRKPVAGSWRNI